MGDLLFAFVHLFLFLGAVALTFYYLFIGNTTRFAIMAACLVLYYFLVLHKAAKKEIERIRNLKKKAR